MVRSLACLMGIVCLAAGCAGAGADDQTGENDPEVKVDTSSPLAQKQFAANVAFANAYQAKCKVGPQSDKPRVLVTGFGRFMDVTDNATGRVISTLFPSTPYPLTEPPPAGQIDPPAPQLSVGRQTLTLDGVGDVDVCAMILPVYWDLSAILIAREMDAFQPNMVMMNGVAGSRQPIWLEMGAVNRASLLDDGSNALAPMASGEQPYAKIIDGGEDARANLLSWQSVAAAAESARAAHAADADAKAGVKLGDVLSGVELAGFPRESNTYLCNNVTYVTGYLMDHPRAKVSLLRASKKVAGTPGAVTVSLAHDLSKVPRVFVHWPTELAGGQLGGGAAIMQAILTAQMASLARGEAPARGDNALAASDLQGGDTF